MSGSDHFGFIAAAYAVTVIALLVTVAALVLDSRAQKRMLARFGRADEDRA